MRSPTPSDAAIEQLLHGQRLTVTSGKVVVDSLGPNALRLLGVMWGRRTELREQKPAEQATIIRVAYAAASATGLAALGEPQTVDHHGVEGEPKGGKRTTGSHDDVEHAWLSSEDGREGPPVGKVT